MQALQLVHQRWLEAEKLDHGLAERLCKPTQPQDVAANADAMLDPEQPGRAAAKEHCAKLTEKLEAKQSIAGVFNRCAARLYEPEATLLNCELTPFSGHDFFYFWRIYQGQGVILVLGQGLNPDGSPPDVLVKRAELAASLNRQHGFPIIATGGDDRGTGTTEAYGMIAVLTSQGIPGEAIMNEAQSINTMENFWFALRQVRRHMPNVKRILVVTSDWHMPRAHLLIKSVLHYFENSALDYTPKFFQNNHIIVEEHAVATECIKGKGSSIGTAYQGSNKASLAAKIHGEFTFLNNNLYGPARKSVGEDTYESWIWGVRLDVPHSLVVEANNSISALWDQKKECNG